MRKSSLSSPFVLLAVPSKCVVVLSMPLLFEVWALVSLKVDPNYRQFAARIAQLLSKVACCRRLVVVFGRGGKEKCRKRMVMRKGLLLLCIWAKRAINRKWAPCRKIASNFLCFQLSRAHQAHHILLFCAVLMAKLYQS